MIYTRGRITGAELKHRLPSSILGKLLEQDGITSRTRLTEVKHTYVGVRQASLQDEFCRMKYAL